MQDRNGVEVQVGDIIAFGEKVYSKGGRGWTQVGTITSIDRYAHVAESYSGLVSSSFVKCTPKFAALYKSGEIYNI